VRGPKPKEIADKMLKGNKDRKRWNKSRVLSIHKPHCPRKLSPLAKEFWYKNSDRWFEMGKLNQYSLPIFEKICIISGKISALESEVGENIDKMMEMTYFIAPDGSEHVKKAESIESKMLRLYYGQFRSYMKDAGISPSETRGIYEFVSEENGEEDEPEF